MKHKELMKNTFLLMVNKASLVLSAFILLPVYTAHFSAAEYGLAALILSYIALLAPVLLLRLDIGIFRHIVDARGNTEKLKTIISSFSFMAIPIVILAVGLICIANAVFHIPFFMLLIINLLTTMVFTVLSQITRGVGATTTFVVTSILVTLLSFAVSIYGVLIAGTGVEIIFISTIVAQVAGSLLLAIKIRMSQYLGRGAIDRSIQKKLMTYSLPLLPDSLSYWVVNISDRTILSVFLGVASAGVYTVANKFSSLIEQGIGVFFQSWTESATVYAKEKDRDRLYSEVFSSYMRIFITASLLVVAFMPFIFSLFIRGEDFQSAYLYIPILMYAMIAHAAEAFIASIYIANDLTKQIAKTTTAGAIINIALNIALVMYIGIWAAALSTLIAYAAIGIYRYYDVRKYGIHLRISTKLCVAGVALASLSAVFYYWNNPFGNIASLVAILACGFILNLKSILWVWKYLKAKGKLGGVQ